MAKEGSESGKEDKGNDTNLSNGLNEGTRESEALSKSYGERNQRHAGLEDWRPGRVQRLSLMKLGV